MKRLLLLLFILSACGKKEPECVVCTVHVPNTTTPNGYDKDTAMCNSSPAQIDSFKMNNTRTWSYYLPPDTAVKTARMYTECH